MTQIPLSELPEEERGPRQGASASSDGPRRGGDSDNRRGPPRRSGPGGGGGAATGKSHQINDLLVYFSSRS